MFISTGINDTPTIVGKAGISLVNAACHAAVFDVNGNLVPAGAGEPAIGIFIPSTPDVVNAGDDVTVQIKEIGLWITGAAVAAGAEVASNNAGQAITAVANAFIVGYALEAAGGPGAVIKVQITKSGYKAGGVVAPLTLAGLTDVAIANLADGDSIVYDAGAQKYINKALEFADLADVNVANLADGDAIVYDLATTSYVNKALELGDLADVAIAGPADNETLTYVAADLKWKNV
jgi:hypothetical protein